MKIKTCLIIAFFYLLASQSAYSQYNIFNQTEARSKSVTPLDTLKKKQSQFVTVNDAYLRNQAKSRRREQNYFEMSNSLLFTQFGYKNWSKGGENTFNGRVTSYLKHIYRHDRFDVTTTWDAAYAMGLRDSVLWKTEDRFRINTALNYRINKHLFYNLNFDLSSQFANGYKNKKDERPASHIFAPATMNLGVGMNYKLDDKRSITLSPVSGNVLLVLDEYLSEQGAFGVEKGKKTKTQFGAFLNIQWLQPLIKSKQDQKSPILSYRTSLQSFWDYKTNPDMTWQSWLDFKVYKYFNVNFNCTLIFNDKVKTDGDSFWQFSEVLGIGVTYTFKNK
ncbi:MAG: DUF3078 domain-containing protein [Rikenellaceae bacterium]